MTERLQYHPDYAVPPGALRAAKLNLRAHAAVDWDRVLKSPLDVPKREWQEGLMAFTQKRAPEYGRFWEELKANLGAETLGQS